MKPEYANTFGLRKVADPQGQILEVTLDISYKYMENALTVTSNGLENVSTPNADHVASIVMNRQSAISIIRLSAKGTDGVMKRRCFRLKLMFAILFTGVLGILQRPWR